eukprot:CAMPEP_0117745464 /NCGR_PEP_ID=MMETSP0947-20121206/7371_1 /TAXON_ID=44440 /ORGANISM="Chattonella subsalsa, Strain CCMP2191" /LENGTH=257 /DNA_ID=CAMNT_0005562611 /DNA_START=82 /DNA_END=855 /DNA_ORIENTATION=+
MLRLVRKDEFRTSPNRFGDFTKGKRPIEMSILPEFALATLKHGGGWMCELGSKAAELYKHGHDSNAYMTDVTASVCMYSLSNLIGQLTVDFQEQQEQIQATLVKAGIDPGLIMRFVLIGLVEGSIGHFWFPTLESLIPGNSLSSTVEKMIADTAIYAPGSTTCYLFLMTTLEKGLTFQSLQKGIERVKKDFANLFLAEELYWTPANGIIYGFLPLEFRYLGDCFALLIYTIGLSVWELQNASFNNEDDLSTETNKIK